MNSLRCNTISGITYVVVMTSFLLMIITGSILGLYLLCQLVIWLFSINTSHIFNINLVSKLGSVFLVSCICIGVFEYICNRYSK